MIRMTRWAIPAAVILMLPLAVAAQAPPADPPDAPQAPGPWMGRGPGFGPGAGYGHGFGHHRGRGMRGGTGYGRAAGFGPGIGIGILERDAALRERLRVTEQQLERLRALRSEHQKAQIRQQAELRVKQLELAEQLRGDSPDRARVGRLLRETNELRFARQKAAMDHLFAVREVFTPEQRAELRRALEERAARLRQRQLERRGPGFGPRRPAPVAPSPPTE